MDSNQYRGGIHVYVQLEQAAANTSSNLSLWNVRTAHCCGHTCEFQVVILRRSLFWVPVLNKAAHDEDIMKVRMYKSTYSWPWHEWRRVVFMQHYLSAE